MVALRRMMGCPKTREVVEKECENQERAVSRSQERRVIFCWQIKYGERWRISSACSHLRQLSVEFGSRMKGKREWRT
jgi:hypothetical protein